MQRKTLMLLAMLCGAWPFLLAQQPAVDPFAEDKANMVMQVLAGDSLQGRGNFTNGLLRAGKFILGEFEDAGLQPLPFSGKLYHAFQPNGGPGKRRKDQLEWNGKKMQASSFLFEPAEPGVYSPKDIGSFEVIEVDSMHADVLRYYSMTEKDLLLWTRRPVAENVWGRIKDINSATRWARLLVHAPDKPRTLKLVAGAAYYRSVIYNIAGMLPGKTKPDEYIVFSAHYDHLGTTRGRDPIMNGANDNASGTTALLMLARYFAQRNDNDRTLVFCAFAGEEIGLKGSTAMAKELDAQKIKAGINLEMLGYPQYGKNTVFITGEKYSSLGSILRRSLSAAGVRVISEPDEERELFARSDNYPFVKNGIAFHTIMASDDGDPCYHQPCDEPARMDLNNLCLITRAIANACAGLINGKETPGKADVPVFR